MASRAVLLALQMLTQHPFIHLRKRLGKDGVSLTQKALGQTLDCSQPAIASIESGALVSHKIALAAFEKYRAELTDLGFSLEELMRWRKPKQNGRAA